MKKELLVMASAVASLATWATTIVETFEPETSHSWTGDASCVETNSPAKPVNGYAVDGVTHTQALKVSGTATRTLSGFLGTNSVDMLVHVDIPQDDPTSIPQDDPTSQTNALSLAFGTNGTLRCSIGESDFIPLGSTEYVQGDWIRLTVLFDCANHRCRIAVNGELQNSGQNGEWFSITNTYSTLGGLSVIGESCIDDLVVKDETTTDYDKYAVVNTNGSAVVEHSRDLDIDVPRNYLEKYGKTETPVDDEIPESKSHLTVAKAYVAGIEPTADATFEIDEAEPAEDGIVLTFPGSWPADSYKILTGQSPDALAENSAVVTTATKDDDGKNKVTVTFPEGVTTLYYRVGR